MIQSTTTNELDENGSVVEAIASPEDEDVTNNTINSNNRDNASETKIDIVDTMQTSDGLSTVGIVALIFGVLMLLICAYFVFTVVKSRKNASDPEAEAAEGEA